MAGALAQTGAAAAPSLEYGVKANYLYKFTPFVEWPQQAFTQPDTPLTICIAGEDPFDGALDGAVRGQTFNGRAVVVRRMAAVEPGAACHVLFISHLTGQSLSEALKTVAGEPVLTVTERSQGSEGGVIQFVMEDGHVRFDIDEAAARQAGLNISSKLLGLSISHRKAGS